jgi:hypothetical protein
MPARSRTGQLTPNQQIDELNQYSPVIIKYDVAADTSAATAAFVAPFPMQITDIHVIAQATSGGGTITPRKGADAMCTAIACATDGAVSRLAAGAVVANAARLILAKGDTVNVIANGAADRGIVVFTGVRV